MCLDQFSPMSHLDWQLFTRLRLVCIVSYCINRRVVQLQLHISRITCVPISTSRNLQIIKTRYLRTPPAICYYVNVECILFDCQTTLSPDWASCDAPSVLHICGSVKIHKYVSSLLSQPPPWMETALSVTYQVQLKSVKKYVVKRN